MTESPTGLLSFFDIGVKADAVLSPGDGDTIKIEELEEEDKAASPPIGQAAAID